MPADLDKLQGTWNVATLETDGQLMDESVRQGARIIIAKNRFTSVAMGATYAGTIRLDEAASPKTFDLRFTDGPEKGNRNLGIYKLSGQTWTICLATRGGDRPKGFASKAGTGIALETLTRDTGPTRVRLATTSAARAPRADPRESRAAAPSGPPTVLEGEWVMVSGVFNGAALGQDAVAMCQRITRGNVTSVMAATQVMLNATFVLDDPKKPRTIDYVNLHGANARKSQAGIVELKGGVLRICVAPPGKPRPADFSSTRGDGRSFTVWRLATETPSGRRDGRSESRTS